MGVAMVLKNPLLIDFDKSFQEILRERNNFQIVRESVRLKTCVAIPGNTRSSLALRA